MSGNKRSLFSLIFGKKDKERETTTFQVLNGGSGIAVFSGNAWNASEVRAAVSAFAQRAAIVQPRHVRWSDGQEIDGNSRYNRLLQYQPNPLTTAYQFYYRVATCYMIYGIAVIYPRWNGMTGELESLWNINFANAEIKEAGQEQFLKFTFGMGKTVTVPFSDLIIVGRQFCTRDVLPDSQNPIMTVIQTAFAIERSLEKYAGTISAIRGILELTGIGNKEADQLAERDRFVKNNLITENNGSGVVVSSQRTKYTPITEKTQPIPEGQMRFISERLYNFYGINEKIIQNKANAEEEDAFYKGALQPFFVQLSQALTNGLFSDRERGCGNVITADINTLRYARVQDKLNTIRFLAEIGAVTMDQALVTMGFPPVGGEEGKRRVQTLNYVNAKLADQYQLGTEQITEAPTKNNNGEGEDNAVQT